MDQNQYRLSPAMPSEKSPISPLVLRQIAARADAEAQAQEDWDEAIKPTTVSAIGNVRQLGGTPLQARALLSNTTAGAGVPIAGVGIPGGVVGDWVPRIAVEEPVEVRKKLTPQVRAVFTVDRPLDGTAYPEAQMLQRVNLVTDEWDWPISTSVLDFLHYKDFYYWNGQSVSLIFTHQMSFKIDEGTINVPANTDLWYSAKRIDNPGGISMATPDSSINSESGLYYNFVFSKDGGSARIRGKDGDPLLDAAWGEIGVNDGGGIPIWTAQFSFGNLATEYADLEFPSQDVPYSVTWELYETRTYSNYFIASERGVVFAHAVNGCVGDAKVSARYFVGTGIRPVSLTEAIAPPSWDWRGFIFSSLLPSLPGLGFEVTAFYWDYYGAFNFNLGSKKASLSYPPADDPDFSNPGRMIQRLFNVDPDTQTVGATPLQFDVFPYSVTSYDTIGNITVIETGTVAKKVPITIPLTSIPGFTGQIQDLCIPPLWSTNQANGSFWQLPFLAVFLG